MGCSRYEETSSYDGENRFSVSFASRAVTDLSATQTEAVYAGMRFAAYRQSSGTFSHAVILTKENTGSATVYKGRSLASESFPAAVLWKDILG